MRFFRALADLGLDGTPITDAGARTGEDDHAKRVESLRYQVTFSGVSRLRAALPHCVVIWWPPPDGEDARNSDTMKQPKEEQDPACGNVPKKERDDIALRQ